MRQKRRQRDRRQKRDKLHENTVHKTYMTRDKSQEKRKKRDKAIDTPDGRQEAEDKNAELGTQICCYSALQHRDGILNF